MLSEVHRRALASILGGRLSIHELERERFVAANAIAPAGYIDGVTPKSERRVLDRIKSDQPSTVWLNGSNLGRLAKVIKRETPHVQVFTFFHNVEALFFLGALRRSWTVRSLAVLVANYVAERNAVHFSDRRVCLSQRDADALKRLYGRRGTDIMPIALEDRLIGSADLEGDTGEELLFVGGGFYANRRGILWFAKQVAPFSGMTTRVVGHTLEDLREQLETKAAIRFVGALDQLQDEYLAAKAAIAPIFEGSGMKTKIAEALMFGTHVIGTAEAYSGYEDVMPQIGPPCDSQEEWVAALRAVKSQRVKRFDPALRSLYERHYSCQAAISRLRAILACAD